MVGWAGFSFAALSDSQRDTNAEIDQHEASSDEIRGLIALNAVALVIRVVGRHVGVVEFSRNDG
jgi:hypothetical protein